MERPIATGPVIVAILLAAVHVGTSLLRGLHATPRSRILSFFGGIAVAYVFLHLLPDLAEHQHHLSGGGWLGHHVWIFSLIGLTVFYGLEAWARRSGQSHRFGRARDAAEGADDAARAAGAEGPATAVFWIHLASFALYNVLVGYLLTHREDTRPVGLALYAVAMAVHFAVNDFGLLSHFRHLHRRVGRWVLAAAPLVGFGLGLAVEMSDVATASGFALLGGGVVLNTLKEELPEQAESRWWAFALGATAFAALLLLAGN